MSGSTAGGEARRSFRDHHSNLTDVAYSFSKNELIHAYGPMKKVVVMNIKKTIERIDKTANLKVTSIRRI